MDYLATFDVLFYLNEIMDLHMLNLGTLASYLSKKDLAARCQIY